MKYCISLCVGLLFSLYLHAQNPTAQQYAKLITETDLKDNLSILASDALEGRETGTRGEKMAAAFIAAHFETLGLVAPVNGSHYQPVQLYKMEGSKVALKSQAGELKESEEYLYLGAGQTDGPKELQLIFAGKATEAEIAAMDVKDKAVAMLLGGGSARRNPAVIKLQEKGASLIVAITDKPEELSNLVTMMRNNMGGGRLALSKKPAPNLGIVVVNPAAAEKLFKQTADKLKKATDEGKVGTIKAATVTLSVTQNFQSLSANNVLGYLEGTDKKEELLVITAHQDHIGKRTTGTGDLINNGADDDGSGTVAVMQLAKAFAQAKLEGHGPRRSILFMTVTGEEKGLLGSDYYTQHPVFPLANTVVNLNIDMIGRHDSTHRTSPPYVYVIGSDRLSSELHTLSEATNKATTDLLLDYTYNAESHPERIYYRSDHWNFAKNNIPIIFYFDGVHEDYHRPSDEVDKIEFDQLAKRAQLVFYTAWEIANRDGRLVVDKK